MCSTTKTLSLLEQKRIQWAKEREEMVGLCGLWGHQRTLPQKEKMQQETQTQKNNLLPPIKNTADEKEEYCRPEEESETSGYLSDSPKHLIEKESNQWNESQWSESNNNEDYWADKKMYKNYKNEKWAQRSSDSWMRQNKGSWYGTPESVSSDDGSRLRWGDRGVGVGHLWEPVVHQPESRLPQVIESCRQTPKWVERGLKQSDGKADILVIRHPDEENQKNFLLGQNVPLPPEIIEEREKKRKKALEHQNAIRKQLEERENKRKEEKENRMREERLEEERIRREQEIERQRYEEEQKRSREKEEKEKRKEEAMKEALEVAEKLAKEEKKHRKVQIADKEPERQAEPKERKRIPRTPKSKNQEEPRTPKSRHPEEPKTTRPKNQQEPPTTPKPTQKKDSSCQFEELQPNNVQFLNVNSIPMDGGLALVLDTPQPDNSLALPPEGVQLALLMSPGNLNTSQLIPISSGVHTGARILTPSKYRKAETLPRDKSTQTEVHCCSNKRKYTKKSGRVSGYSDSSEKSNSLERPSAHHQCAYSSRYRSRSQPRLTIDERPKWGINRPSIQYKKQSEKDPYYQRKLKQRLKKTSDSIGSAEPTTPKSAETVEEKLLESDIRFLKCESEEEEEPEEMKPKDDIILRNGYRMNSNPSSPIFVPIQDIPMPETPKADANLNIKVDLEKEQVTVGIENLNLEILNVDDEDEDEDDDDDDTVVPGSIGYLTQQQLETIQQITTLRQGLKKLEKDISNSRSITPFSDTEK